MIRGLFLIIALVQLIGASAKADELPEIDFDKIVFLSSRTQSGKVQLVNGEYRGLAAPGSAAETLVKLIDARAFGKLGGKEAGAVILCTDPGGSGTFYDLALLTKGLQGWINQDSTFLGDRVKIHSLTITGDTIVVDLTTQGPGDPMCCPTYRVIQRFLLSGSRLFKTSEEVIGRINPMLIGPEWKWQQSIYSDGTKAVPPNSGNYTLKLLPDGKVSIRADCNLGGGVYRLDESKLSIEITHTTRAACPPESLEQNYIRDLNAAAIYFMKGDILNVDLKHDAGTMKLMQ